ncbi:uncharacterized protein V6R79_015016 [Siganus canaliculatus]
MKENRNVPNYWAPCLPFPVPPYHPNHMAPHPPDQPYHSPGQEPRTKLPGFHANQERSTVEPQEQHEEAMGRGLAPAKRTTGKTKLPLTKPKAASTTDGNIATEDKKKTKLASKKQLREKDNNKALQDKLDKLHDAFNALKAEHEQVKEATVAKEEQQQGMSYQTLQHLLFSNIKLLMRKTQSRLSVSWVRRQRHLQKDVKKEDFLPKKNP